MTTESQVTIPNDNMLFALHNLFSDLPVELRQRVCAECGWSMPTFYRKIRPYASETKNIKPISNAEYEKVLQIFDDMYLAIGTFMEKFRAHPSPTLDNK
ncbi:MAG TPA: hypothetical protein VM802_01400 [Chitinophaga sp.]|uniref:hypothetical protein n=1 Tax=Chitinophaga sp. TaxID=1869181 RepID=UPI002BE2C034|nr:hypothetical protein [Chitinophaga sp.]HVI43487.1 hypothetical protein [Chitinophaga sp.]